nr:RNA polymerase sigma factor [Methylomonas fluvii]
MAKRRFVICLAVNFLTSGLVVPKSKPSLFDRLFQRHSHELRTFAGLRGGNEFAEDLVQEAYLRLMQHPEPESIDNARAFLYRTIANLSVDQHRRQNVRDRFHAENNDDQALHDIPTPEPLPEDRLASEQELHALNGILQELPEATRNVFVLYRLEGLSHKEIGRRLGVSERNSVRLLGIAAQHVLLRFASLDD